VGQELSRCYEQFEVVEKARDYIAILGLSRQWDRSCFVVGSGKKMYKSVKLEKVIAVKQ
jgi:hypothetical protein